MSDVSATSRENARQLAALQEEHEKRMEQVRADQKHREQTEIAAGDAVISHIREAYKDRADTLRTQSEASIRAEERSLNRAYSELRKNAQIRQDYLNEKVTHQQEQAGKRYQDARQREANLMHASQKKLLEFMKKQQLVQQEAERYNQEEINDIRAAGRIQQHEAQRQGHAELEKLNEELRTKSKGARKEGIDLYNRTKTEADERLTDLRKRNSRNLEEEQRRSTLAFNDVRERTRQSINQQQVENEDRLAQMKTQNRRQMEDERDRALRTNENVRDMYAHEQQRVQRTGEENLRYTQDQFKQLSLQQKVEHEKAIKAEEAEFNQRGLDMRQASEEQIRGYTLKHRENLKKVDENFKRQYELTNKAQSESLRYSNDHYLKTLYQQQRKFDENLAEVAKREGDPFYAVKDFNAKLTEFPEKYVLTGRTAPHEKDKLQVRVQGDKISLSTARSNEQQFTDGPIRTATNTNQTIRQDFTLAKPAEPKAIFKRVDDDGYFNIIIPKKGFSALS